MGGRLDQRRRIGWIALSGVILLVLITGWGFRETSKPSFCSSCHIIEPYAASWKTSDHAAKGVSCVDCHFEPGVVGYTKGKIYSFMKLTQFAAGQTEKKPEAARLVIRSACLQCHEYIRNPQDPRYPQNIVVQGIKFPHDFHLNRANLSCSDCHSGLVHGAKLVGEEKPQAAADPVFCSKCHTGDIAPILFGEIKPAGREHPGAPKIDVAVWRNSHWRLANQSAEIDGVKYDQIQPQTCRACHQDPTVAKGCKSCHFARIPEFSASPRAEKVSFVPVALFVFLFVLFMTAVFLKGRSKERFFSRAVLRVFAVLIVISDAVVVYFIVSDVLTQKTGQHEIGPTTVWTSYLLLSISALAFLVFEGSLMPSRLVNTKLPKQDESDYIIPKPIRRMGIGHDHELGEQHQAPSSSPDTPPTPPEDRP